MGEPLFSIHTLKLKEDNNWQRLFTCNLNLGKELGPMKSHTRSNIMFIESDFNVLEIESFPQNQSILQDVFSI